MSYFIFYENNKIKGIFTKLDIFKRQTFYYIINKLVEDKVYENTKICANKIKEKLRQFYTKDSKIEIKNIIWTRKRFLPNVILEDKEKRLDNEKKNEDQLYTILNIIKTKKEDRYKPIPLFDIVNFY